MVKGNIILEENIEGFLNYLNEEEKSENTKIKYIRDVRAFVQYCNGREIDKETVISYKQNLIDCGYAVKSINSMLASINSLFSFLGWNKLHVKSLKVQKQIFCREEKELTRAEYERLCRTADKKRNIRLNLILQTICSTGIRVSELQYITLNSIAKGEATILLKGKIRKIFIQKELQKKLINYAREKRIDSGPIFITKTGKPISRTNVWREMKSLCREAEVNPEKVFPHNLRHLFARVYYSSDRDIARLADILGHSSIDTTRIYIISTGTEHRRKMENMRLIL